MMNNQGNMSSLMTPSEQFDSMAIGVHSNAAFESQHPNGATNTHIADDPSGPRSVVVSEEVGER